MLLTGSRSSTYHTVHDTPDRLDWARIDAVSRWLDAFVRDQCARPEARVEFLADGRDDASTLDTMRALLQPLEGLSPLARHALARVGALRGRCDRDGRLGASDQEAARTLLAAIEQSLA